MAKAKQNKKPTWDYVIKSTKAYRDYLKGLPIDETCKTKGFMISKEEISRLMGDSDGIRVYIGLKPVAGGFQLEFFPVAVKYNSKIGRHDDINVPKKNLKTLVAAKTADVVTDPQDGLGEVAPCPSVCGGDNSINS